MKRRIFYSCLLLGLCFLGFTKRSTAQSITTNTLSVSAVCAGADTKLSVPFSTTGVFTKGNIFTAQISDASGGFSGTITNIGTLSLSLSAVATNTISATIPKTLAASSAYKIRVISDTPAKISSNTQPITLVSVALPSTSTPAPYCEGDVANALSATASAGGTLQWYGTNPAGTPASTPTVPDTKLIGSTPYYVGQSISGCTGPKATILVVVNDKPNAPGTSTKFYCVGEVPTPLSASALPGATLIWYTGPLSTTGSTTAPTPSTTKAGSTSYYVSQSLNGCEGPRTSLVVTINSAPVAPTVSTPTPFCQSTTPAPLSASAVAGATLRWWGTSASNGSFSTTPTVPGNQSSATYYVSQVLNGCDGPRAPIAVTVKPSPNSPGTSPIEFCQNTAAPTLTATFAANATPNWYGTNASGGTASTTPPSPQNTTPGQTTYYVGQTVDGCISNRVGLTVTVKATPSAPGVSPVNYCNNATAQPLTASGSNIKWFDGSENPLNGAPTPATNSVGDQTYKVTQTVNGCESGKATLIVTIKPLPALPGVSNLTYCQAQQDQPAQTVSPLTANGQNLRWYNPDGNAFPSAPTPPISQTGTFTYQVSQTVNNCESGKATLQVVVNTLAAPKVAKSLLSYCINDKASPLQATGDAGSTLQWIDPYGRITSDAPTPSTLNTNVAPGGDAFYVYQIGSNTCVSARATIKVLVNATPTLALTGSTNVNLGQKVPLSLKFTSNPPFSYTLTGGYTGISNTTDTTISVVPRGNTTYQVIGVSNSCGVGLPGNPSAAIVTVNVPTLTTGSLSSSTLCAGTTFQVPFTTSGSFSNGNLFRAELISVADTTKKYDASTGGTSSPITATLSATLATGQYYVRVKASNPDVGIIGTTSPTIITVRSKPVATLSGTQTIYEGTPANLTITFGGDGPWTLTYADSLRSFPVTTNANPYTFEVRPARTSTYQITSLSNTCGSGIASGKATVSVFTALGVEDTSLEPLVNVYPVPTGSTITVAIDVALTHESAVLSVTDLSGRLVHQQTTHSRQTELDLSSQPSGLYLLRIQVGNRQAIRKVLKQ